MITAAEFMLLFSVFRNLNHKNAQFISHPITFLIFQMAGILKQDDLYLYSSDEVLADTQVYHNRMSM